MYEPHDYPRHQLLGVHGQGRLLLALLLQLDLHRHPARVCGANSGQGPRVAGVC